MKKAKLKPCPFCGRMPKKEVGDDYYFVVHPPDCWFYGTGRWNVLADEVAEWNKRTK